MCTRKNTPHLSSIISIVPMSGLSAHQLNVAQKELLEVKAGVHFFLRHTKSQYHSRVSDKIHTKVDGNFLMADLTGMT